MLREAAAVVTTAQTASHDQLDPQLLAQLRTRYDNAVHWGIPTNRHRDWARGNHPGYNLAKRLHGKAERVWTNNAANKPSKAPSDIRPSPAIGTHADHTRPYCRLRFYLVSARNHGLRAIHNTLTGNPWLHTPATA